MEYFVSCRVEGTIKGLHTIGKELERIGRGTAAKLASLNHRYGEINRYAKIAITTIDGPQILKSAVLQQIRYQHHPYGPLCFGMPATTPVVVEGRPVRLLELLPPDQPDSDIVCGKVHVYSIERVPNYEAIS